MKNIPCLGVLCALLLPVVLCAQSPETVPTSAPAAITHPGPKPGDLAPDFTVVGPDGKEIKLSDFRGQTVLIDIWATWCGPCVASMPHNSELAEKHAKDGLVILAVCADDSRANYDGWVKRNATKYKFLTAHDTAGKDGWDKSVFNTQYGVSGFPTLFLVDKEGKLVGSTSGGGQGENPHVTRLLAKGGVPVDTSHLPPEEISGPKSIPMIGKTLAIPAGGKTTAMTPPTVRLGTLKFDEEVADFAAVGVDGQTVKLSSFKGKPVLVAFWTGARSPGDDFAKLQAAYKDQGLAVWAINVATDRAEFDTWAKANAAALGYTVSWDPAGKAVMEALSYMKFGIGMYPAFMVVNADGYFRGGLIGMGPKIAIWTRFSLERADVKLTAEDKAKVEQVMNEMFTAREKPAAASPGGM
ncbi:MAG: TlpA disulfide reductase family protein, partial [Opitutae bacterium]